MAGAPVPCSNPRLTCLPDESDLTHAAPSVLHPARGRQLGGSQGFWTHLATDGAGLGLDLEQWVSRNPQRLASHLRGPDGSRKPRGLPGGLAQLTPETVGMQIPCQEIPTLGSPKLLGWRGPLHFQRGPNSPWRGTGKAWLKGVLASPPTSADLLQGSLYPRPLRKAVRGILDSARDTGVPGPRGGQASPGTSSRDNLTENTAPPSGRIKASCVGEFSPRQDRPSASGPGCPLAAHWVPAAAQAGGERGPVVRSALLLCSSGALASCLVPPGPRVLLQSQSSSDSGP